MVEIDGKSAYLAYNERLKGINQERFFEYTINNPEFALVFDCISRSHYMKEKFKNELKTIKNILLNVPTLGILSFGEIKGFREVPLYHNKTLVIGAYSISITCRIINSP
ncbi:MAG: FIST C-terminal domain-containing protein [Dictyoglomaceae bacterium]